MTKYVVLALLLLGPMVVFAQPACTDNSTGCTAWTSEATVALTLIDPDCKVTVFYQTRVCNGVTEYFITNYVPQVGCEMFDPNSMYFHKRRDQLTEYVTTGFLSQISKGTVPHCSTGVKTISNVYVASCGIWVCCTYNVTLPAVSCDPGFGTPPHTPTNPPTVQSCKWKSCGTQCCKRTYEMCEKADGDGGTTLDLKLTGKVTLGPCSGAATFAPRPCETDCQ